MIREAGEAIVSGLPWWPEWAVVPFFYAKALAALVATILVIAHMSKTWRTVETRGRRFRYYVLLGYSALVTGASVGQVHAGTPVNWWNIGGLVLSLVLIYAMCVSIAEDGKP